jgi:ribonucleoside-diphosphate reductase alpha chain
LHVRRKKIVPGADGRVDFVDQNGDRWQEFPVFHPKLRMWMDITGETDVSKSPYAGCCAEDLDWRMRVRIQAVATRHIDHSISSTANLPEDVTVEEVATIYEEAWRSGCKGFTVYRKNCRSGVLVEAHVDGKGHGASAKTVSGDAAKRPRSLLCEAHRVRVKGVDYSVLVGMLDGAPYEVFAGTSAELNIPRKLAGGSVVKQARGHYSFLDPDGHVVCESITQAISDEEDALTRMVSTSLRHGVPLRFIVHQLEKSRGTMVGFSKGLARVLKGYIEDGTSITGENCSECGQAAIVRSEGCLLCKECGHSKCS